MPIRPHTYRLISLLKMFAYVLSLCSAYYTTFVRHSRLLNIGYFLQ